MKRILQFSLGLLALLSGCQTQIDPNYVSSANQSIAAEEKASVRHEPTADQQESVIRLWADRPDYLALLRSNKELTRAPRIVTAVAPSYPITPYFNNLKAQVTVHAIIDERGAVKDARVLESSDSRFNKAAVEAVLKWKFLPGESEDGPTMTNAVFPIQFDGVK